MGSFGFGWGDYVSVAEKRRRAERAIADLRKQRRSVAPVSIAGRMIANSFWGKSWCTNLERYSDYASRLPRGRSYVRNGFVVDLQIAKGKVAALISGSELYEIEIAISPVAAKRWKAICRDCAGTIDSLVELLQGRLAEGVMDRVCREGDGLFPAPDEIKLSCSCPDWADMCKHVAAALYGIGARLDESPQLLFVLRGVDENELLAGSGQDLAKPKSAPATVLEDGDLAALFGLEMAGNTDSHMPAPAALKPLRRPKSMKENKATAPTKQAAMPEAKRSRRTRIKGKPKGIALPSRGRKRSRKTA